MTTRTAETRELEDRYERPGGVLLLWFGFLGGAAAWKMQLVANYMLVPYACWHDLSILIHAASLVFFLMALAAGWLSWGRWKDTDRAPREATGQTVPYYDTDAGGVLGRTRFMALSGLIINPFFALIILGQWLPNLILSPCHGIS